MKQKLTGFLGRAFSYPEYAEAYKSAGDVLVGRQHDICAR